MAGAAAVSRPRARALLQPTAIALLRIILLSHYPVMSRVEIPFVVVNVVVAHLLSRPVPSGVKILTLAFCFFEPLFQKAIRRIQFIHTDGYVVKTDQRRS
jgi:hypothetical protein